MLFNNIIQTPPWEEFAGIASEIKGDNAIMFTAGQNSKIIAHEILHSGGLLHTFTNQNELTFEKYSTDNIMDYSESPDAPVHIPTNGTWKWQWEILWKHDLIKNE